MSSLHGGITYWILPVYITFIDLSHISTVTAMSNSLNWKFCVPFQLSWNCIGLSTEWLCYYFFSFAYIQGSYVTKSLMLTIWWTLGGLSTLRDYDLAQDPAIRTRFDDLDLISRSQVCQNHKLQIVFGFLFTVVNGAWFLRTWKRSRTVFSVWLMCV